MADASLITSGMRLAIAVWANGNSRALSAVVGVVIEGRKSAAMAAGLGVSRRQIDKYVRRFREDMQSASAVAGMTTIELKALCPNREIWPRTPINSAA